MILSYQKLTYKSATKRSTRSYTIKIKLLTHQFVKMNEENDLGGNGDSRNESQGDTKNEENKSSSQVSGDFLF